MRGFPLLRFFLLLLAVGVAALGLHRLTPPPPDAAPRTVGAHPTPAAATAPARFHLELSRPASRITLAGHDLTPDGPVLTGHLDWPAGVLGLQVIWCAPSEFAGFARLTVEAPGQPTLIHTFSAHGDLDDVWDPEIP